MITEQDKRVMLRVVKDVLASKLAERPPPEPALPQVINVAAPSVASPVTVDTSEMAEVLRNFKSDLTEVLGNFQVTVDMTPVAKAIEGMSKALLSAISSLKGLPAPVIKNEVNVPEQPPLEVTFPEPKPMTATIKHSDGTTSHISLE